MKKFEVATPEVALVVLTGWRHRHRVARGLQIFAERPPIDGRDFERRLNGHAAKEHVAIPAQEGFVFSLRLASSSLAASY
jgi:hypothetical protein